LGVEGGAKWLVLTDVTKLNAVSTASVVSTHIAFVRVHGARTHEHALLSVYTAAAGSSARVLSAFTGDEQPPRSATATRRGAASARPTTVTHFRLNYSNRLLPV